MTPGRQETITPDMPQIAMSLLRQALPELPENANGVPNYWVIPANNGEPRWIIPRDSRLGLPALTPWHPFSPRSQLKWQALLAAYRCGIPLPGMRMIPLPAIEWPGAYGKHVPVIYVGTPTRTRKLVVTLINPATCRAESVLKLPIGDDAAEKILHEARFLATMNERRPGMAPHLLWCDAGRGQALQQFIAGRVDGLQLTPEHWRFMARLRSEGVQTSLAEASDALRAQNESIALTQPEREALRRLLDTLRDETPLPAFIRHGDFSPWNVLRTPDGIQVVDWEHATAHGLPLSDLLGFLAMRRMILKQSLQPGALAGESAIPEARHQLDLPLSQPQINRLILYYCCHRWLQSRREGLPADTHFSLPDLLAFQEACR